MIRSALVVGAGSIGARHARNLRGLGVERISVYDVDPARAETLGVEIGGEAVADLDATLAAAPDVVLVCTPPVFHVEQALAALAAGAHVFVEKPLSHAPDGLDRLADAAAQAGRVVQVGYNLHFHPALQALAELVRDGAVGRVLWARAEFGQYLPDWRPEQDYRRTYTARQELGGGILLDASHELAYLIWLLGRPAEVACFTGQVSALEVDVEDSASLLLRFPSGTLADVHLDFVQRTYSRSCRLAGEEGTLLLDLAAGELVVERPGAAPETIVTGAAIEPTYLAELEHFLGCAESGTPPLVGLQLGRDVVDLVAAAKTAAASGVRQVLA